jgi:hypothetical protein
MESGQKTGKRKTRPRRRRPATRRAAARLRRSEPAEAAGRAAIADLSACGTGPGDTLQEQPSGWSPGMTTAEKFCWKKVEREAELVFPPYPGPGISPGGFCPGRPVGGDPGGWLPLRRRAKV